MNIQGGGLSFEIGATNKQLMNVLQQSKNAIQNFSAAAILGGKEVDAAFEAATAGMRPMFNQLYKIIDENEAAVGRLQQKIGSYAYTLEELAQRGDAEAMAMKAQIEQLNAELKLREEVIAQANEQVTVLSEEEDRLLKQAEAAKQNANAQQSLKQQLRQVKEALAQMEQNGERGTELFKKLQQEAGRLTDALADAQTQARILSHDNAGLQGLINGLSGTVGAFSAAQGAVALFTDKNEDLQKVMLKVQSLMSITMGLQQVANTLNKDSAFMLVTVAKGKELLALATNKLSVALGVSTVAAQALMATLTLGLSAAITAIVVMLDKFTSKQAAAKKAQDEFNSKVAEAAGKPLAAYYALQAEWLALTDSMKDREKWVQDNADKFTSLGYKVTDAKQAEDLLVKNTQKFVEACMLKAKALAAQNLATEKYEAIIKKQQEIEGMADTKQVYVWSGAPGVPGQYVTVKNSEKEKAKKELAELEDEAQKLIKMQTQLTAEEQALLKQIGNQAGQVVAGSVAAAEQEVQRLQQLYKDAANDTERKKIAAQITAAKAELDKISYQDPNKGKGNGKGDKDKDPFAEQLTKRKELYTKYLKWSTSADETVRNAAATEFAGLLAQGTSYIDYLEKQRAIIESKGKKTAADIKNLHTINNEIANATKEAVISDFDAQLTRELEQCKTIGEMLTVIERRRGELSGDNSDVDNAKKGLLDAAEKDTKQQAKEETAALLSEYASYLQEKIAFDESYNRNRELLQKQAATATTEAEKQVAEAALAALEKKRMEYAKRSGSEQYDELLQTYKTYQQQQSDILEKFASQRAEAEKRGNMAMIAEINRAEQAELSKLAAQRLMSSESWNQLFTDISRLSTTTINKLLADINGKKVKFGAEFNPADLKAINDQLTKARNELEKRNPFLALKASLAELRAAMQQEKLLDSNDPFIKTLEARKAKYKEYTDALNSEDPTLAAGANQIYADLLKEGTSYTDWLKRKIAELNQQKINLTITVEGEEQLAKLEAALNKEQGTTKSVGDSLKETFSSVGGSIDFVKGCFDSVTSGLKKMGVTMDEETETILNDIGGIMDGASQVATGIATGNPLSIIQGSIGLLSSAFDLFNSRDRKAEKSIKKHQKAVNQLQNAYKGLEDAVNRALGESVYQNQAAEIKNIRAQQAHIRGMIEDEKSKKKTDWDRIEDWQEQLAESERTIKDIIDSITASVTQTNAKDLANDLADALITAWGEGKTSAEAYGKVANDVLKNAVKNALKMQFLEEPLQRAIKQLQKDMGFDEEGNGSFDGLTDAEQARFKNAVQAAGANFAAAMDMYKDLFQELDESDPTTLSGAIKGASQESIDLLAGQTNAVRQNQVASIAIIRQQLLHLSNIDSGVALTNDRLNLIYNALKDLSTSDGLRSQGITL